MTVLCASLALAAAPFAILTGFKFQENGLFLGMAAAYIVGIWAGVYWTFHQVRFDEPESEEPLDTGF